MPPFGPGLVPVQLEIPEVALPSPLLASVAPSGIAEIARLVLSLPGATPPGRYEGAIRLSDRSHSLVVEVEPDLSIAVLPESLAARARPSEELNVDLTVLNQGNVSYDVRKVYAFPLADVIGIDRALSRTASSETKEGGRGRADRFADELASGRGGPVRVEVHRGVGAVMPREVREIKATLKLPGRLKLGRTYSGAWRLADAAFSVRIEVGDESFEEEAR
jgi:hypothetical protein